MRVFIALLRSRNVWERIQERHIVGIHAIADLIIGSLVRHTQQAAHDSAVTFCHRSQLDVGHVIPQTTAIRKTAQVAGEHTHRNRLIVRSRVAGIASTVLVRRKGHVESQQICWSLAREVKVGKVWHIDAGQQDGDQIRTIAGRHVRRRVIPDHRIEHVDQAGQLRVRVGRQELCILRRILGIPVVFLAQWNEHFVDQRIAQARNLYP